MQIIKRDIKQVSEEIKDILKFGYNSNKVLSIICKDESIINIQGEELTKLKELRIWRIKNKTIPKP